MLRTPDNGRTEAIRWLDLLQNTPTTASFVRFGAQLAFSEHLRVAFLKLCDSHSTLKPDLNGVLAAARAIHAGVRHQSAETSASAQGDDVVLRWLSLLEHDQTPARCVMFGAYVSGSIERCDAFLRLYDELANPPHPSRATDQGVESAAVTHHQIFAKQERASRVERAEEELKTNPDKPQLAWDLARTKLESYLDRNLSQGRSIYCLTILVMVFGFAVVTYGLYEAFSDPKEKLAVSIVASVSGVILSFIGRSFLVLYHSTLSQSDNYVTVLDRINAVGMAVQVIASVSEHSLKEKDEAKVTLANNLLYIYGSRPARPNSCRSSARSRRKDAKDCSGSQ